MQKFKSIKQIVLVAAICLGRASLADAFMIPDHATITEIAVKEFFQCVHPDLLTPRNAHIFQQVINPLTDGSKQEDLDYLNKLLAYSHFYNPYFSVETGVLTDRCSSDDRVRHIQYHLLRYGQQNEASLSKVFPNDGQCQPLFANLQSFVSPFKDIFPNETYAGFSFLFSSDNTQDYLSEFLNIRSYLYLLGRGLHHLQDMSSPTHVVPISHFALSETLSGIFPQDQFESRPFPKNAVLSQIQGELHTMPLRQMCAFTNSSPQSLFEILDESARDTLQALTQNVPIYVTHPFALPRSMTVTWEKWYDLQVGPDGFGDYGFYGNTFGLGLISLDSDDPTTVEDETGWRLYVAPEVYFDFSYQQYRRAIQATKRGLSYGLSEDGPWSVSDLLQTISQLD